MEESPNLTYDPATSPCIAGLRPFRNETYRLEPETRSGKFIVHNYGHGGAGITMSWGCASMVRDIVTQHGAAGGVAVLGAGIMGLTAATLLADANLAVTIYAEKFTPCTTSDVAGGQWSPSFVEYRRNDPAAKKTYFEILRRSKKEHEKRLGAVFGVSKRPNYTTALIPHLDELPRDIVPRVVRLAHLPFAKLNGPGFRYDLLLAEPPILMPKLQHDLAGRVRFVPRKFVDANDVTTVAEKVIVNCTGLGAGKIFNDLRVVPIKGQLVLLKPPQPNLDYLYSGHGYLFPRTDAVVVGGSKGVGETDVTPDPAICKQMVDTLSAAFDGDVARLSAAIPDWLIINK